MCANYPAAAFVIMMVTTVLLVPSSAAPAYHESSRDFEIADSWWYNACGHHHILHSEAKKNESRSDMQVFRIIKNQMKLFNDFFNQEIKNIKDLYADVELFDNVERKSFDWLPKYTKPTNNNRSKTTLKEFHADLQYYVVAVNYLEKIEVHSNAKFNWTARNDIFVRLFHQIKSLICEVEVGVNITDQTVAKRVPPNYPLKRGLAPHFENLTQMKLQDTGVVYKLRDFTRKWSNNLMKRLPTNRKRESESGDAESMENIEIPDENENSIVD